MLHAISWLPFAAPRRSGSSRWSSRSVLPLRSRSCSGYRDRLDDSGDLPDRCHRSASVLLDGFDLPADVFGRLAVCLASSLTSPANHREPFPRSPAGRLRWSRQPPEGGLLRVDVMTLITRLSRRRGSQLAYRCCWWAPHLHRLRPDPSCLRGVLGDLPIDAPSPRCPSRPSHVIRHCSLPQ